MAERSMHTRDWAAIGNNFLSNIEFLIEENSKGENLVAAGFSLRLHRRDACATKKIPRPQALHFNTLPLMSNLYDNVRRLEME
jgi:hypothetical protein